MNVVELSPERMGDAAQQMREDYDMGWRSVFRERFARVANARWSAAAEQG